MSVYCSVMAIMQPGIPGPDNDGSKEISFLLPVAERGDSVAQVQIVEARWFRRTNHLE
jgi:hypothetical protein